MKAFLFVCTLIVILFLLIGCNAGLSGVIIRLTPSEGEIAACKGVLGNDPSQWHFSLVEKWIGNNCYVYQQMK
jgi:hypothetical protein